MEFALKTALNKAVDAAVASDKDAAEIADHLQKKVDIKILSSEISGSGVTAVCRIASPDIAEFVDNFDVEDCATKEALVAAVIKAIDAAPVTEKEITVGFKSNGSGYELIALDEFLDAYTCGCLDLLKKK